MKITVTADVFAATMDVSVEDILLLKKYDPKALTLFDEKGKPEFVIDYKEGESSVDQFGIVFGSETRDEDKKAAVCGVIPPKTENVKEWLADKFGVASKYLSLVEAQVTEAAKKVRETRQGIMENITVE